MVTKTAEHYDRIFSKMIAGKYYWMFHSLFQWSGFEYKDIRHYSIWDDAKYINWKVSSKYDELYSNVHEKEESSRLVLYFDVNVNWKYWVDSKIKNKEIVLECFVDLILYCIKYWVYVECVCIKDDVIVVTDLWKDIVKMYAYISYLSLLIDTSRWSYKSHLSKFVQHMLSIKKRRWLLVFSDFMDLEQDDIEKFNYLRDIYPLFLFGLSIDASSWKNYQQWYLAHSDPLLTAHAFSRSIINI